MENIIAMTTISPIRVAQRCISTNHIWIATSARQRRSASGKSQTENLISSGYGRQEVSGDAR